MKIYIVDLDKKEHVLEAVEGWSVMEIIREYGLPIKAECGGACACATCHVYVDASWIDKIPPIRSDEEEMLDDTFDVLDNSRLSCQIILNEALDGLKATLAKNDL